jgi:hypothetical protein
MDVEIQKIGRNRHILTPVPNLGAEVRIWQISLMLTNLANGC